MAAKWFNSYNSNSIRGIKVLWRRIFTKKKSYFRKTSIIFYIWLLVSGRLERHFERKVWECKQWFYYSLLLFYSHTNTFEIVPKVKFLHVYQDFFILLKYVSGFTLDINPVMFSFPCRFFYVTKEISYLKRNAGNPRVKGQV